MLWGIVRQGPGRLKAEVQIDSGPWIFPRLKFKAMDIFEVSGHGHLETI